MTALKSDSLNPFGLASFQITRRDAKESDQGLEGASPCGLVDLILVQGFLAHKKPCPPTTLQQDYA